MTTTIEMTVENGRTTQGAIVSCRSVHDECCDSSEIGEAIATAVIGTQSSRKILALAWAVHSVSGGSDINTVMGFEQEFVLAASELIKRWSDTDSSIQSVLDGTSNEADHQIVRDAINSRPR